MKFFLAMLMKIVFIGNIGQKLLYDMSEHDFEMRVHVLRWFWMALTFHHSIWTQLFLSKICNFDFYEGFFFFRFWVKVSSELKNKYSNEFLGWELYGKLCSLVPWSGLEQKLCNFFIFLGYAKSYQLGLLAIKCENKPSETLLELVILQNLKIDASNNWVR